MQIDRLLEMVLILLNSERQITARELSERFEVSTRTVYRDIDTLSLAGIPVYTTKGKGGGIGLLQEYTIGRSFVTEKEQKNIVFALQSLNAAQYPDIGDTLSKISRVFKLASNPNWIEVDFSHWGSGRQDKEKWKILQEAVLTKRIVSVEYTNSYGKNSNRLLEPLKLVYKKNAWYLWAYCRTKMDYRMFRISRIAECILCGEEFVRDLPDEAAVCETPADMDNYINLTLRFSKQTAYRVYDDFCDCDVEYSDDGSAVVMVKLPYDDWVMGYILSFGNHIEVLEPDFVRKDVAARAKSIVEKYHNTELHIDY